MNDSDALLFHAKMAELWHQQHPEDERPADISAQDWKNRYRISAKLPPSVYADLQQFCRDNDLSINSALKTILTFFFKQSHV